MVSDRQGEMTPERARARWIVAGVGAAVYVVLLLVAVVAVLPWLFAVLIVGPLLWLWLRFRKATEPCRCPDCGHPLHDHRH